MKKTLIISILSLLSLHAFADNNLQNFSDLTKILKANRTIGDCQILKFGNPPGGIALSLRQRTGNVVTILLTDPKQSPTSKVTFDRQAGTYDSMDGNFMGWAHRVFRIGSQGQVVSFTEFTTLGGTTKLAGPVQTVCNSL